MIQRKKPGPRPHEALIAGETITLSVRRFPVALKEQLKQAARAESARQGRRVPMQEYMQTVILTGLQMLKA